MDIFDKASTKKEIVRLSYDIDVFCEAVSKMVENGTGLKEDICVDYDDVLDLGIYFIRFAREFEMSEEDIATIENFTMTDMGAYYDTTLSLIDLLFDMDVDHYIENETGLIHGDEPLIIEVEKDQLNQYYNRGAEIEPDNIVIISGEARFEDLRIAEKSPYGLSTGFRVEHDFGKLLLVDELREGKGPIQSFLIEKESVQRVFETYCEYENWLSETLAL